MLRTTSAVMRNLLVSVFTFTHLKFALMDKMSIVMTSDLFASNSGGISGYQRSLL